MSTAALCAVVGVMVLALFAVCCGLHPPPRTPTNDTNDTNDTNQPEPGEPTNGTE